MCGGGGREREVRRVGEEREEVGLGWEESVGK